MKSRSCENLSFIDTKEKESDESSVFKGNYPYHGVPKEYHSNLYNLKDAMEEMFKYREHKVLLMYVGCQEDTNELYFMETVEFCDRVTPHISVIVNKFKNRKLAETAPEFQSLFNHVGWFFPKICTFEILRKPSFVIRSLYTFCYSMWRHWNEPPTVIFVDANCIILPLLKWFFKCKVFSFTWYQDLLKTRDIPDELEVTLGRFNKIPLLLHKYADELLVPSMSAKFAYMQLAHGVSEHNPFVFYPKVWTQPYRGERYWPLLVSEETESNKIEFAILSTGVWDPKSRFEVVIDAFVFFIRTLAAEHQDWEHCALVIDGRLDLNNFKQKEYYFKIRHYASSFTDANITVGCNYSFGAHCVNYIKCHCVIDLSTHVDFNWTIMECQYYGRPLIAAQNRFAVEFIKHDVNGYLTPIEHENIATYINYLYAALAERIAANANICYENLLDPHWNLKYIKLLLHKHLPVKPIHVTEVSIRKYDSEHILQDPVDYEIVGVVQVPEGILKEVDTIAGICSFKRTSSAP